MRKGFYAKLIVFFVLVSVSCQPSDTQPRYNTQICPLTRHNIEKAEGLIEEVQELLKEVQDQGGSVSEVEVILTGANELLQKAKTFYGHGHNCTAGNVLAVKAIDELKKAKEMLKSMLHILQKEEYAVYTALINTGFDLIRYKYGRDEIHLIVIRDHTSGSRIGSDLKKTLEWIAREMPEVEQETLDSFWIKNGQSHPLSDFFDPTIAVALFSEEEVRDIFHEGAGWEEFYVKYPFSQGIMVLSRVGFNSGMDQALVYLANEAEDSIGAGYYVLLTKEDGIWTIHSWINQWV